MNRAPTEAADSSVDIDNTVEKPEVADALINATHDALQRLEKAGSLDQTPSLTVWRAALQRAGIDPTAHPSAIESLARRITQGETIPQISSAVDLANAA